MTRSNSSRLILSLFAAFVFVLLTIVSVGIGGVALVDVIRSYVAGEGFYSKAQKDAVLALHSYVKTGHSEHFEDYLRLIEIARSDGRARRVLEDSSRPVSESYADLEGGQNHPSDVAGLAWLFRNFGHTALFSPAIEQWREADQKIENLHDMALSLREAVERETVDGVSVQEKLSQIDTLNLELTELEFRFANVMGEAARSVRRLLYHGMLGLSILLTTLVGAFAFFTKRRIESAEREIHEREQRFRDVVELAADWIWETDEDLRFNYLSDRLEAVTDLPKETFLGKRRWELDADPGPLGWQHHIRVMQNREKIESFEYSVAGAGGSMRTLRITGKPIFDDQGTFVGYRGTGTDVSTEVVARKQAQERRELLETTFENLGQGVSVVSPDLDVIFFNRRFLRLLDFPEDYFAIGDPFEKFIRFNAERGEYGDLPVEEAVRQKVEDAKRFEAHTFERLRPDGTVLEIRGHPLPSGGFVTTYRDVTLEWRAQAALEESERRIREVIDRALDAYVSFDESEAIVDWNPAAEKMFGWSRSEAVDLHMCDLIAPQSRGSAPLPSVLDSLREGDSDVSEGRRELLALRKSGERFSIEISINSQVVSNRRYYNAFVRDITERKEAEQRLLMAKLSAEVASRAKSEFLANMSHELRTPLNAIIGFSDVMSKGMMGPISERYINYANDIRHSGDHLLSLINDILDISSVEAGKTELKREEVDLQELVSACVQLLRHRADADKVSIVNDIPSDAPRLSADPRRLRQIVLNLVGNAVKFSPPSAVVTIKLDVSAEEIALEVIDEGIGIEPGDIERVFEPFVQLRRGVQNTHEGTGLGLSLVKRFMELHDGEVSLRSKPGEGTIARAAFPIESMMRPEEKSLQCL